MARLYLALAAASGFLAVALGAFGAHALRGSLDAYALSVYDTAVLYHFVHTLALFGVALLLRSLSPSPRSLAIAGGAFAVGVLVFSGSLYLLAVTGQRWLGAVTPVGGVAFLLGWISLLVWTLGRGSDDG